MSVALFGFLIGVSWAVYFRFVVRFCIVCGAFQHILRCVSVSTPWVESMLLRATSVKDCVQEEGAYRLSPSST